MHFGSTVYCVTFLISHCQNYSIYSQIVTNFLGFNARPKQWREEEGENGATAPGVHGRGASKKLSYKILHAVTR